MIQSLESRNVCWREFLSIQPGDDTDYIDRRSNAEMLQMRFGQTNIPRAAHAKGPYSLRHRGFDAFSQSILASKGRCLLPLAGSLERFMLVLWSDRNSPSFVHLCRPDAMDLERAATASGAGELDLDHRVFPVVDGTHGMRNEITMRNTGGVLMILTLPLRWNRMSLCHGYSLAEGITAMENLCLAFVNSERHDYLGSGRIEDRLEQSAWREQFLTTWNLQVHPPLDLAQRASLRTLRTWLRGMIEALAAGQPLFPKDLAIVNAYLSTVPFIHQVTRTDSSYQAILVPQHKDWKWVQEEIVSSFMDLITKADPSRIKLCSNPPCRWIYYDESKNHSRSWCDETCANLIRVRRARARQRVNPHVSNQ